jgi:Zn-dependent protease with chaperone function
MIGVLAEAQLFALAALAFAIAVATLAGVGVRAFQGHLGRIEPLRRSRALEAVVAAPIVLGAAGVVACALPSLAAAAMHAGDHCGYHDGHPHLCPLHLPEHGSTFGWVLLASALAWALARVVAQLEAFASGNALVSDLRRKSRSEGDVTVIESDAVFAVTAGLLSPRVLVSRGLAERLGPAEHRAVLAHERAHARRRDALRLAVARVLWSSFPAWLAEPLFAELALAYEEICDRDAAAAVGDPLIVADAIVQASRGAPSGLSPAVGIGERAASVRVLRLLDPPTGRSVLGVRALLLTALAVLALAEPLHHATETLLGLLPH